MIQLKEDHKLIDNTKDNCRQLNIGKKKQFTIVEGIKLFSVMSSNNTDNLNKMTFWQNIEKSKMIPERTAEQMKKFWTKYEHYTVEQWLVQAIHEKTYFSFSHKEIPSSTFEAEFRRKYEIEFMRIENM